jgi:hypothetical protein
VVGQRLLIVGMPLFARVGCATSRVKPTEPMVEYHVDSTDRF